MIQNQLKVFNLESKTKKTQLHRNPTKVPSVCEKLPERQYSPSWKAVPPNISNTLERNSYVELWFWFTAVYRRDFTIMTRRYCEAKAAGSKRQKSIRSIGVGSNQQVSVDTYLDRRQIDGVPVLRDDVDLLRGVRIHAATAPWRSGGGGGLRLLHWRRGEPAASARCATAARLRPTRTSIPCRPALVVVLIIIIWATSVASDRQQCWAGHIDSID